MPQVSMSGSSTKYGAYTLHSSKSCTVIQCLSTCAFHFLEPFIGIEVLQHSIEA